MKKASIKLKSYTSNVGIVNNDNLNMRIFNGLVASFGILALCYVLILGNTVFNIVERKALEMDARNLATEVGDLGLSYLSMSNKIDISLGHTLGFKEAKATFATRKSVGLLSDIKIAKNDL